MSRTIIILATALCLFSAPAFADHVYGTWWDGVQHTAFDNGAWGATGIGMSLLPNEVVLTNDSSDSYYSGELVFGNSGTASGIELIVGVETDYPDGFGSISIVDNSGVERMVFGHEPGDDVFTGMFEGMAFDLRWPDWKRWLISLTCPESGPDFYWSLYVLESFDQDREDLQGPARTVAAPFEGPITIRMNAGPGQRVLIQYARVIGENLVAVERSTWAGVKALYR